MKPFTTHTGVAAPLVRINIDTDAIIPSREMKSVSKKGMSGGLFAGWRYLDADTRTPNPEFVLNKTEYQEASILFGGDNFGCGSSREHAVWALLEYGFRAILCPSFGAIFYQNCIRNGIVPVVLPISTINILAEWVEHNPQRNRVTINLTNQHVIIDKDNTEYRYRFDIAPEHKNMLINGLDVIDITLENEDAITEFERKHIRDFPWVQPSTSK